MVTGIKDLSVVLSTHNRPSECSHSLQSLLFQTRLPSSIVIVENSQPSHKVLDNPSFTSLVGWAAQAGVDIDILSRGPLGMVGARILGEDHLTALRPNDLILMADDDQLYPPNFILETALALNDYDICGSNTVSMRTTEPSQTLPELKKMWSDGRLYAGGTIAYRPKYSGLWKEVSKKTRNIAEDLIWQFLADTKGASFTPRPTCPGVTLHLDVYSPSKYGGTSTEQFLTSVIGSWEGPVEA